MDGEAVVNGGHGNNIGYVDELPWKITNIGELATTFRRGKKKALL